MVNPTRFGPRAPFPGARVRGLGDYPGDPNTTPLGQRYSEERIFDPTPGDIPISPISRRMSQFPITGQALPIRALPANPNRCYLLVQNIDAATVLYMGIGSAPTATTGFQILAGGGNFLADYMVPTDDIYLWFAGGAAKIAIVGEGVFVPSP